MKNYIIGLLLVCLLVFVSMEYKHRRGSILQKFPVEKKKENCGGHDPVLCIYILFSGDDCANCLEVIEVLNHLPSQFTVTGIVPENELANESELREKTKARFDLISIQKSHKKFSPNYSPSIFGVGKDGRIYFVLPAIPGEKEYFENFLINLYGRLLPLSS